jgi:hypothetical protein
MAGEPARELLSGLVDYAGLFPPAALAMDAAVREYARWRSAPEGFMLGRFVAPSSRLEELRGAAEPHWPRGVDEPWRVSALLGDDVRSGIRQAEAFNFACGGRAVVDAVELKAAAAAEAEAALALVPAGFAAFVEAEPGEGLEAMLAALGALSARAKVRTGGVVAGAIPSPGAVARFVAACVSARVPFKATAGLHHAVRGERALTYASDSPRAVMHGFLNVFAAAVFARTGASLSRIEAVLSEDCSSAFRFGDSGLSWGPLSASAGEIAEARRAFALSFGSCSFAEPVAELRELGLLAPAAAGAGSALPGRGQP